MATSKKVLVDKYIALGGSRADLPEDLDEITAAEIQDKIDALEEATKLKAQLQGSASSPETAGTANENDPAPKTPDTDAAPKAPATVADKNEPEGVTFTLIGSATWSSARIPGKLYKAGEPFKPETGEEASILSGSGRFKVEG